MTTTAYEALAAKLVEVTAERDRARNVAVALMGQIALIEGLAATWETDALGSDRYCAGEIRAVLNPEADQ